MPCLHHSHLSIASIAFLGLTAAFGTVTAQAATPGLGWGSPTSLQTAYPGDPAATLNPRLPQPGEMPLPAPSPPVTPLTTPERFKSPLQQQNDQQRALTDRQPATPPVAADTLALQKALDQQSLLQGQADRIDRAQEAAPLTPGNADAAQLLRQDALIQQSLDRVNRALSGQPADGAPH